MILNHKCSRSVDQFYRINVLWLPLLKSSLINCVVSFSEAVHQKCRSCPKQIRVKRKWQILASQNLPRLEGALFQGLVAWRIIFFYFRNHFLKIHTRGIPKMSDFYVFSHFWPRKWLLKLKKRVLTPSFSHLTFWSQMGTLSSHYTATRALPHTGQVFGLVPVEQVKVCTDDTDVIIGTYDCTRHCMSHSQSLKGLHQKNDCPFVFKNFQAYYCLAGWQKLHGSMGGTRRKVWTRTKILSRNIRYFVAN